LAGQSGITQSTRRAERAPGPGRLPVVLTSFVGRDHEVAAVADLLRDGAVRLLTLTGPGGAGKTRVALRVAEAVAPDFADGVVFVALAPLGAAAELLPAVARAFGVREGGNRPLMRRLAEALEGRHLLLLLDNFEHLMEAAPAVAEILATSAGPCALVTSRAPLRVSGEQEYPVPPLALPEPDASSDQVAEAAAVRLFVDRARAVDPAFELTAENADTIAAICRRLDGVPLAVELAAAKVRLLAPESLLGRLEQRLQVLTGGARDQPTRLRTMRDAVAWSHDLLAPSEQMLFRRLAVFVGGFDLDAAEAVAESAPDIADMFAGVDGLAAQSLVRRLDPVAGAARFAMLQTIRDFGLECLDALAESGQVRRAHAFHYLAVAERAEPELLGPHADAWLARLAADHGNVAAALGFFVDVGDHESGAVLAGALREYWYETGRWAEGRAWLDWALSGANLPDDILAKTLVAAGFLAHYQGDDRDALPFLERGLDLLRRRGLEWEAAYAQYLLGVAAEDRGDYATATSLLLDASGRLRMIGDATSAAYGEAHLGIVSLGLKDPPRAVAHGEAARALAAEAGSRGPAAVAALLLGDAARERGELALAAERYREHLQLIEPRTAAASEDLARAVASVAVLAAARRQPRRAAVLLGIAERLREALGLALALPERVSEERAAASVRDQLGPDAFQQAVAAGRALALRDVVDEVRHVLGPPLRAPAPPDASASGLSRREVEVLRLIADGRTNRQIAETLFLSVRTVERHVTNLYGKIGAHGRAEATAFALRHGFA
jgi:predicted ATPase/DNA-binding CsgD family transcriptional regulator